jgi:glycerophosphoryl diester phosphodiesterase
MALELLKSVTGRTLIESHRGMQGSMPENSWPAIKMAHELGADLIEVDIQMSRDRIPFLRHNYQLPDGRWCNQLPWDVLKNVALENEPLPLLEDALVWARDERATLALDIKSAFGPEGEMTGEVVRLLERTNMKEKVLLLFIDHHELLKTKTSFPELTVRALLTGSLVGYSDYLKMIKADCVCLMYGMLRPADVEEIHAAGVSVALGGLWNPDTDLFQSLDIDIFNHGNPVEARKILERR